MNNVRKIIEERLENARNDWLLDKRDYLRGQMVSYRDCLNLIPAPRTEADILKDFEKLGYSVYKNDEIDLVLGINGIWYIHIWKVEKTYRIIYFVDIQEHKLLNELFEVFFDE